MRQRPYGPNTATVERMIARAEEISDDEIEVLSRALEAARRDRDAFDSALAAADRAARRGRRRPALQRARSAVLEAMAWYVSSPARTAAREAVLHAVTATVVEDLLDRSELELLRRAWRTMSGRSEPSAGGA